MVNESKRPSVYTVLRDKAVQPHDSPPLRRFRFTQLKVPAVLWMLVYSLQHDMDTSLVISITPDSTSSASMKSLL